MRCSCDRTPVTRTPQFTQIVTFTAENSISVASITDVICVAGTQSRRVHGKMWMTANAKCTDFKPMYFKLKGLSRTPLPPPTRSSDEAGDSGSRAREVITGHKEECLVQRSLAYCGQMRRQVILLTLDVPAAIGQMPPQMI
mmetsp:Transcript_1611/g.2592  ORF Transcript_1611/g.2592 Transcript_1611/m.2592 type:complete len:141 (+) Transcript_1611:516-938(+)